MYDAAQVDDPSLSDIEPAGAKKTRRNMVKLTDIIGIKKTRILDASDYRRETSRETRTIHDIGVVKNRNNKRLTELGVGRQNTIRRIQEP